MTKRVLWGPNYLERFSCIGSDCEETCCSNWNVEIDPNTYKKYCSIEDAEFREKIKASILKFPFYKSNKDICGKFLLNEQKKCPLLTEEKLCSIQLKYGEAYLSHTCHSFPRVTNCVDGIFERSLTVACPEAARVVLLNKEQFKLQSFEEDETVSLCINRRFETNKKLFFNRRKKYFYVLREITIEILKDRNYDLHERMLLVLIFYSHLGELLRKGKEEEVSEFITSYNSCDKTELLLKNDPEQFGLKHLSFNICNEIFEGMAVKRNEVPDYKECYEMAIKGFEYPDSATREEKEAIYAELRNKYFKSSFQNMEYIFENYLINKIYGELFPFTNHGKLYDAYLMLVVEYSLLRYHLIGMSGCCGEITEDMLIKLIYSYTKVFSHYMPFYYNILKFMKLNLMSGFRHIAVLIKDV